MRDTESRRRFLTRAAGGVGLVTLAGCSSRQPTDTADTTSSKESATTAKTTQPAETETTTASTERETTTKSSPRDVSFDAPHGATIEATAYGTGQLGVVLVPQINLDKESWRPQAQMIADMGHLALAIDEDPDNRSASVRGAMQYLTDQGVSADALIGASTGGEAVVVANAESKIAVDATVTLSAAGGVDHASSLDGRSLFVVSTGDEARFVRIARELHQHASEPKQLVEYDGAAHGQRLFESPHASDLNSKIRSILDRI